MLDQLSVRSNKKLIEERQIENLACFTKGCKPKFFEKEIYFLSSFSFFFSFLIFISYLLSSFFLLSFYFFRGKRGGGVGGVGCRSEKKMVTE